jgi:fibronectin-binding autotransporter adhesin
MKTNIQPPRILHRAGLFLNRNFACALLALTAPLAAKAEQTVFLDTFGSSSLNQTNIPGGIPGGTASDLTPYSATSYTIGSSKDARNTRISSGHFNLITANTSSGNTEAQARFSATPIKLESVGDYIELTYTFTDTRGVLQNDTSGTGTLLFGLFNSFGVAPQSGAAAASLQNSGFAALTTAATGGTREWVGYGGEMANTGAWRLRNRPAQISGANAGNNNNQNLLYGSLINSPGGANGGAVTPGTPNLVIGTAYTVQFRATLTDVGQITLWEALYTGTDTSGTLFSNTSWVVTGANVLTTQFDSLAVGYRAGTPVSWTNDITQIKVVAGLAAQAGPYYFVTSSGDPCAGGLSIGLSGSVATNTYLLYTNGVDTGLSTPGTGSAISFGLQTVPATYTVYASNTVTASVGPMLGSASVLAPGITINTQPASVSVVSNLPASFTVAATGNAMTYQWYKNGALLNNGGTISGATNATLTISAAQPADVATVLNGYTVVIQDPCGTIVTSTPPAALTLTTPRNLIWAGANPDNSWDFTEANFLLSGSPTVFGNGDNVTFNDSSANTSLAISNDVTATLIAVTGTSSYTFNGPNKITGVSQLAVGGTGTLTIANDNDHTGGTIVSNGATLSIGDGVGVKGSLTGTVTVSPSGTLNYSSSAASVNTAINMKNALAGSGTVNFNDGAGATYATGLNSISSNFSGTINILGFTRLHASDNNAGYAFGNGSTVNVPANTQAWLDRSATAYNNTFNIAGDGWIGVTIPTGAISIFGCTVNGPINLLADARIGGTINGGTIQSVISGPYRLEVRGNTNSYVLTMGPTNGSPQAYASTLITAGAISAANSNAISSGPLTLDSGGDLRVNGNNVTVASLTSINSGSVLLIEGPRVRNMHATLKGTLTVGTDDTSSQFDGTFSDGAAAAFGLTKVGAGTLTLTAISTNTGAVTVNGGTVAMSGSGSFSRAALISVGSGAFYDASAAGGTLTLNSGQTLGGSGTVTGNVIASAGSTIAPGSSVGTLTVAGNVTLGGGMTMELNRSLAPNSDRLVTSGGSITGGGTLTTTNIGSALQVGDTFQLFAAGVSGITANLQTVDVLNAVTYTWNNNIAASGSIQVASVTPIAAPALGVSQSGNTLTFSWTGPFKLQSQTNSLSVGVSSNWGNYPGGSTSPVVVTINPANPTVFFRLSLQ